jgi:hypothetical protein
MARLYDSTDRCPGEYIRFALGFIGFIIGAGGVMVASLPAAVLGAIILVGVVASFSGEDEF